TKSPEQAFHPDNALARQRSGLGLDAGNNNGRTTGSKPTVARLNKDAWAAPTPAATASPYLEGPSDSITEDSSAHDDAPEDDDDDDEDEDEGDSDISSDHDLRLDKKKAGRSSIVDNMLLSLDQIQIAPPPLLSDWSSAARSGS
ncbi:hypothetical protein KEM55_008010, partial [Ascosphaera atra]